LVSTRVRNFPGLLLDPWVPETPIRCCTPNDVSKREFEGQWQVRRQHKLLC